MKITCCSETCLIFTVLSLAQRWHLSARTGPFEAVPTKRMKALGALHVVTASIFLNRAGAVRASLAGDVNQVFTQAYLQNPLHVIPPIAALEELTAFFGRTGVVLPQSLDSLL